MSTGITVNCGGNSTASPCNEIKLADDTAVCKEDAANSACICNDAAFTGADAASCTKADLACSELGEKACGLATACEWDSSACKEKAAPPA